MLAWLRWAASLFRLPFCTVLVLKTRCIFSAWITRELQLPQFFIYYNLFRFILLLIICPFYAVCTLRLFRCRCMSDRILNSFSSNDRGCILAKGLHFIVQTPQYWNLNMAIWQFPWNWSIPCYFNPNEHAHLKCWWIHSKRCRCSSFLFGEMFGFFFHCGNWIFTLKKFGLSDSNTGFRRFFFWKKKSYKVYNLKKSIKCKIVWKKIFGKNVKV